jgi:outer membrane protein OmpA-like peptidoglycan-associated protein
MKKNFVLSVLALLPFSIGMFAQIPLSEELVVVSNERGVNSEELEFSPVFYKDGIVFISTRHESLIYEVKDKNIDGKNIMSIYRSRRNEEGFLGAPQPLADELIFRLHEGPVTFDRTANTIFFTRNESQEQAPDGYKKLQIYAANKEDEVWKNIQKLSFNNVNYNYCHPTISPDEDIIFISSDVPGGYGGMDLYAVYRTDGKWSQMINLGEKVNTPGNEVFPYIAADKTLYFSSDGHGGLGNLDLFFTTQNTQTEEWRTPSNLGSPFNSTDDDFGFIVDRDNKNGYFSSDRSGGFGGDDIYKFYIESQSTSPIADTGKNLDGLVVLDEDGNPMVGAQISAINFKDIPLSESDGQMVKLIPGDGDGNFILDVNANELGETAMTGENGKADIPLRRGNYVVKVAKEGYLPQYVVITPDTDLDNLNITLQKAVDCVSLTGKVMREGLGAPVSGAAVKIVDVDTKEAITVYADATGFYEYCIDCKRTYSIYAEKDNITSAPSIVSTKGIPCNVANSHIELPLYLGGSPIYAGMTIRLPNIYFNFDDASLRPDAYQDLDEVVGLMNNFTGLKLELASHTDSRGGKDYNKNLSYRRSQSVMRYISSKGINESRLEPIGYGESQIRNRCTDGVACSEAEHQYNRRTEIKILEMGESLEGVVPVASVKSENDDYSAETVAYEEGKEANKDKGGQPSVAPPIGNNNENTAAKEEETLKDEYYKEGTYAVIAGTFANHNYAVRRASELMEKGYLESSIVKQERNGLFAVFVQTYNTKKEAFSLVKKLDNQQIHAYVLKR